MIEPWTLIARLAIALAAQPNFAFEAGKTVGVAECRAVVAAETEAARLRGAQADTDFMRWTPERATGNPRF